jgi:hypothetical protein
LHDPRRRQLLAELGLVRRLLALPPGVGPRLRLRLAPFRCRCSPRRRRELEGSVAKATHRLALPHHAAGGELGGCVVVERRRVQRGHELLLQPLGRADSRLGGECRSVVGKLRHELALLGGGALKAGAVAARHEFLLRLAELAAGLQQLLDVLTPVAHEVV